MKIDYQITLWVNQFVHKSVVFNNIEQMMTTNHLLKGALFIIVLWHFWFKKDNQVENRQRIILGIYAAFTSMAVLLVLTRILPFRARPRFNTEIDFINPSDQLMQGLQDHSSFPSDHASLFFALSTTIFFLNRRFGILAFLYTIFAICFSRLYLGLHYASDLIIGGIIGLSITQLFQRSNRLRQLSTNMISYEREEPALFYSAMFLLSYQIANLFEETRACLTLAFKLFT